ncbi:MAG: ankyrin repeat domain-containing protein [candidate division Zixibacteria bacterium]
MQICYRFIFGMLILLIQIGFVSANDLYSQIEQGNLEQVKLILNQNPDQLNVKNANGMTPLNLAAYRRQAEIVKELLDLGADASIGDNENSLPIHNAAVSGDTLIIGILLSHGVNIDAQDVNNMTPLLFAISFRKYEAANFLLAHKASILLASNGGMTALHYAVIGNQAVLIERILDLGANVNAKTGNNQTSLFLALWNDYNDIAEILLSDGASVEDTTSQGISLLYYALAYRDEDIAHKMIEKGINFTQTNNLGMTMLHYAAARGFNEIVELLLDKGVDIEAKCINGKTALYYANIWGHQNIVEMLLAKNAGPYDDLTSGFTGEYLGQTQPGRKPQTFVPNGLLTPYAPHGKIMFSPDGNEMFWCHQAMPIQAMWYMKMQEDGIWSRPAIAPFTDPALDYADGAPSFSPDGKRIYFHSHIPVEEGAAPNDNSDLFYVEKSGDTWGKPQRMDAIINNDNHQRAPTISNNGNLYFIGEGYEDGFGASDIYVSEFIDDKYTQPKNLGAGINTGFHELMPSIAPDESYLIFGTNRPLMERRGMRLYVGFKKDNGDWTGAFRLRGWLRGAPMSRTFISHDQKYIFYQEGDDYKWFSTQVIEDIKKAVIGHDRLAGSIYSIPEFEKSEQAFESVDTYQVVIGDLDGDNDLDAVCANMRFNDSKVWLNDGAGNFSATEQKLTQQGHGAALGDLDDDGDLDIFITCAGYGQSGVEYKRPSKIYLNNGKAEFYDTGQNLGDSVLNGNGVSLNDIDGDGDLDAMVIYYQEPNGIYLNDGSANFTKSESSYPDGSSWGDIDNDGDVDLFIREVGVGFKTMLNDGKGNFTDYWRHSDSSMLIGGFGCLRDLDGDGDPDAIMASGNDRDGVYPTIVWLNDGTGVYEKSNQELNVTKSGRISLADLNGDGNPDAFVTNFDFPSSIWINDGKGNLLDSGLRLGGLQGNSGAALGDLDGDGDIDAFISEFLGGSNTIWFNKIK